MLYENKRMIEQEVTIKLVLMSFQLSFLYCLSYAISFYFLQRHALLCNLNRFY